MLERNGHTVVTADNGELAVEAAGKQDFDIILMDMQMPVLDGPQAMQAIRDLPSDVASRPIIALTADAIREHRQGYLDAGADIVVTKPINWPILFSEMARLADQAAPVTDTVIDDPEASQQNEKSNSSDHADSNYGKHILLDDTMIEALEEALDKATLKPMVKAFKQSMGKYIEELDGLVDNGQLQKSKRTAHALKELSAQFGASRVSAMAKDIEESMTDLEDIKGILPLLRQSIDRGNFGSGQTVVKPT